MKLQIRALAKERGYQSLLANHWPKIETPLRGTMAVLVYIPFVDERNDKRFLFQENGYNVYFSDIENMEAYAAHLKLEDIKDLHEQGMIPEETYKWACVIWIENML